MCWTSYSIPVRHIAQEDIKCYKVFDKLNIVWDDSKKIKEAKSLYRKYLYIPYIINPGIIGWNEEHIYDILTGKITAKRSTNDKWIEFKNRLK